jgi:hypothetical protein
MMRVSQELWQNLMVTKPFEKIIEKAKLEGQQEE